MKTTLELTCSLPSHTHSSGDYDTTMRGLGSVPHADESQARRQELRGTSFHICTPPQASRILMSQEDLGEPFPFASYYRAELVRQSCTPEPKSLPKRHLQSHPVSLGPPQVTHARRSNFQE